VSQAPDFVLHDGYALRELGDGDADELHAVMSCTR
jgi:hypothetical protein